MFNLHNDFNGRCLFLDAEFTGLDIGGGDRIMEIGIVEMQGNIVTGREFHSYINPEREVSSGASRLTGIFTKDLFSAPLFYEVAPEISGFIGSDPIIIHGGKTKVYHNGEELHVTADIAFLGGEFNLAGFSPIPAEQFVDQTKFVRDIFGNNLSLDKTLKAYGIDTSARRKNGHNALLDAQLLARVFPLLHADWINGQNLRFDATASSEFFTNTEPDQGGNSFFDDIKGHFDL